LARLVREVVLLAAWQRRFHSQTRTHWPLASQLNSLSSRQTHQIKVSLMSNMSHIKEIEK